MTESGRISAQTVMREDDKMICEPCGKNLDEPSAACSQCYTDMRNQVRFLMQQLEAHQQAIIKLEKELYDAKSPE